MGPRTGPLAIMSCTAFNGCVEDWATDEEFCDLMGRLDHLLNLDRGLEMTTDSADYEHCLEHKVIEGESGGSQLQDASTPAPPDVRARPMLSQSRSSSSSNLSQVPLMAFGHMEGGSGYSTPRRDAQAAQPPWTPDAKRSRPGAPRKPQLPVHCGERHSDVLELDSGFGSPRFSDCSWPTACWGDRHGVHRRPSSRFRENGEGLRWASCGWAVPLLSFVLHRWASNN